MKKEQIKTLLPSVFQRTAAPGSALFAILDLMEALHGPSESVLGRLDMFFDPYRSPDEFVPYLASWVDLQILLDVPRSSSSWSQATLSTGMGRLRELTAGDVQHALSTMARDPQRASAFSGDRDRNARLRN